MACFDSFGSMDNCNLWILIIAVLFVFLFVCNDR